MEQTNKAELSERLSLCGKTVSPPTQLQVSQA